MEKKYDYVLERDGQTSIGFNGECLASDSDHPVNNRGNLADNWSEYALYETETGKYVFEVENFSKWENIRDTNHAIVAANPKDLFEGALIADFVYDSNGEKNRIVKLFKKAKLASSLVEEV